MRNAAQVAKLKKLLSPEVIDCPYCSEKFVARNTEYIMHLAVHKMTNEELDRKKIEEAEKKRIQEEAQKKDAMEKLANRLKGLL